MLSSGHSGAMAASHKRGSVSHIFSDLKTASEARTQNPYRACRIWHMHSSGRLPIALVEALHVVLVTQASVPTTKKSAVGSVVKEAVVSGSWPLGDALSTFRMTARPA